APPPAPAPPERFFVAEVPNQPSALDDFHFRKQPRRLPAVMSDEEAATADPSEGRESGLTHTAHLVVSTL
ncbi:MAG: hypothetical protein HXY24_17620, partial [Rubrivivax sp.]|nr:hypothetical protein [Rubrivivax sp.]